MKKFSENPVYKKVLADSFGGIMYDLAKQGTYDADGLIAEMEAYGIERLDGIEKGAYDFLTGGA